MAPGQQVRAFAFVLVLRQVSGRALLLGGQLGFEFLDPGLECGNDIARRQAAWGPCGQWFGLQLVKINSNQGLTTLVVRARQAVALDDGARPLGRDVETIANLHVGELFEHPAKDATEAAYRRSTALEKRRRLLIAWEAFLSSEAEHKVILITARRASWNAKSLAGSKVAHDAS
jgi:hypothetical protein